MSIVAVLGAGRVGAALARTAVRAGHEVRVAGIGAAADVAMMLDLVAPAAAAADAAGAVSGADIVLVAIPLPRYLTLDASMLAGHVVVDAMNHWEPTDGRWAELDDRSVTSSELVARHLDRSRVVKSLNHIGYHDIEDDGRPSGSSGRRALAAATDDPEAGERVVALLDTFGFDGLVVTPFAAGVDLQPGGPVFGADLTLAELEETLLGVSPPAR